MRDRMKENIENDEKQQFQLGDGFQYIKKA